MFGAYSKNISISSIDRDCKRLTESNSNFILNVPSYSRAFNNIRGFQVLTATFANSFYNIPDGQNIFKFNTDTKDYEYTIPEGQYNFQDLFDWLIANVAEITDIQIDPITSKTTITFINLSFITSGVDNPIAKLLGFGTSGNSYPLPPLLPSINVESPGIVNMSGPTILQVQSRNLSNSLSSFDQPNKTNIICSIPIDVNFGEVCQYEVQSSESTVVRFRNIRNVSDLDIQLRDEYGNLLDLQENHITLTCKLWYNLE